MKVCAQGGEGVNTVSTQSKQKLIFLMAFSFCLNFPKGRLPDSKLLINFSGSFWTFSCVIGGWGQSTVQTF